MTSLHRIWQWPTRPLLVIMPLVALAAVSRGVAWRSYWMVTGRRLLPMFSGLSRFTVGGACPHRYSLDGDTTPHATAEDWECRPDGETDSVLGSSRSSPSPTLRIQINWRSMATRTATSSGSGGHARHTECGHHTERWARWGNVNWIPVNGLKCFTIQDIVLYRITGTQSLENRPTWRDSNSRAWTNGTYSEPWEYYGNRTHAPPGVWVESWPCCGVGCDANVLCTIGLSRKNIFCNDAELQIIRSDPDHAYFITWLLCNFECFFFTGNLSNRRNMTRKGILLDTTLVTDNIKLYVHWYYFNETISKVFLIKSFHQCQWVRVVTSCCRLLIVIYSDISELS